MAVDIMSQRAHYSPPWADVSIIGIAGSSGSGKSTLSHAIVSKLNLPWVVILSMVTPILAECLGKPKVGFSVTNPEDRTHFTRLWMQMPIDEPS
jgi:hypothetical protein